MKRLGLVLAGLALAGAVNTADAQLTMQMGNGWSATFAGNINAFWIYTDINSQGCDATGSCTSVDGLGTKINGIGTGLLPAFFTFDAKGTEGPVTLGAHIGFAPQVTMGRNVSSSFGTDAAGAQIDMRQVYGTVGGKWGQILFGKELGVFLRQNILTDLTLFGAGPLPLLPYAGTGPSGTPFPRGTALGRIGYGYLYTDFRAQFTYSTPSENKWGLTFGVFEPITVGEYSYGDMPRFEAEFTYKFGDKKMTGSQFFISGAYGHSKVFAEQPPLVTDNPGLSSDGFGGGVKVAFDHFSFVGSGFYASGMGTAFMGDAYLGGSIVNLSAYDVEGSARSSYGYNLQAQYTGGKFSIGASYGGNYLNLTDADNAAIIDESLGSEFDNRTAIVGQLTYNWTKSLRVVGEYTYAEGKFTGLQDPATSTIGTVAKQTASQIALGMMLFY